MAMCPGNLVVEVGVAQVLGALGHLAVVGRDALVSHGELVLGAHLARTLKPARANIQGQPIGSISNTVDKPGLTAYLGWLDIGRPWAGETVVVAAASGAVGSVVGQIGHIRGCTVVGIAGGEDKCRYLIDELGFGFCVDHRADDLPGHLAAACLRGIDFHFESVGGAAFDAVLPLLDTRARVPV